MSIFTRFRDIINSNINAMLDNAEEPEKLIKLMVGEMEDTLIEIKAACAGAMAGEKRIERQLDEIRARVQYWADKAPFAVKKGRDDLAREALFEKRKYSDRADALERELLEHNALVKEYQDDIRQLEEKLSAAREKERILIQRHVHANRKRIAQEELRRIDSSDAMYRFDELENRIERMEAEADLVNYGVRPSLEEEIENLEVDDEIEEELRAIKSSQVIRL